MKLLIVFGLLFFIFFLNSVNATWWDADYTYNKAITITSSGILTINSTINLTIDHATLVTAGKSLANGDDVRVIYTNSTGNFSLDRQNVTAWNTANTEIRFRIQDGFSAGQTRTNYTLYYGYSSATNPPNDNTTVFMLAYDFNSALGAEWATWGGACDSDQGTIVRDTWMRVADVGSGGGYNCGLQNTKGKMNNIELFIKFNATGQSAFPPYDYTYFGIMGIGYYLANNRLFLAGDVPDYLFANVDNTISTWIWTHNATYDVKIIRNGTMVAGLPYVISTAVGNLGLGLGTNTNTRYVSLEIDWLFASDFSADPNVTLEIEQTQITIPTSIQLYLNGTQANSNYNVGSYANFTALINVSGLTINMASNYYGWSTQSGVTNITNITYLNMIGTNFNLTVYYGGNETYSSSSTTYYFNVTVPTVTVSGISDYGVIINFIDDKRLHIDVR